MVRLITVWLLTSSLSDFTPSLNLCELITFPTPDRSVNLVRKIGNEIGDDSWRFGALLLDDKTGERITAIEEDMRENAVSVTRKVLQLWLQGKGRHPVTWGTLVSVLNDIELVELARLIESVKL